MRQHLDLFLRVNDLHEELLAQSRKARRQQRASEIPATAKFIGDPKRRLRDADRRLRDLHLLFVDEIPSAEALRNWIERPVTGKRADFRVAMVHEVITNMIDRRRTVSWKHIAGPAWLPIALGIDWSEIRQRVEAAIGGEAITSGLAVSIECLRRGGRSDDVGRHDREVPVRHERIITVACVESCRL